MVLVDIYHDIDRSQKCVRTITYVIYETQSYKILQLWNTLEDVANFNLRWLKLAHWLRTQVSNGIEGPFDARPDQDRPE